MRPDDWHWHLTQDVGDFLTRAGAFLRSRPVPHTVQLTVTETLRIRGAHAYGVEPPVLGVLQRSGEVRATLFHTPPHRLNLSPLTPGQTDTLAVLLAGLGHALPGVGGDHATATAFAGGLAAAHRSDAGPARAAAAVPPRRPHPTEAASSGPGPGRRRAGPRATRPLAPRVRHRHRAVTFPGGRRPGRRPLHRTACHPLGDP